MNIRTLLFSATVLTCGALVAQPTLNAGNCIGAANSDFPIDRANTFNDPGSEGASQTYGYWNLATSGNRTYQYLDPSISPSSASVPGVSVLSTDGGTDTLYWGFGSTGLELKGEFISIVGSVVAYTDPGVEIKLPLAFGDTWTDNLAASYTVSGFPVTRTGVINGNANAWGTLELPETVLSDILRVKVLKVIDDQSAITSVHRSTEVNYFFNGILGHPVLKLTLDTTIIGTGNPAVTRTAEWMFGPGQVGVNELSYNDVQFTAYPNPATAEVNLSFDQTDRIARSVEIFNASGQSVRQLSIANTGGGLIASAFDVSDLAQGVYQVRLSFSDGTRATQRLVVR